MSDEECEEEPELDGDDEELVEDDLEDDDATLDVEGDDIDLLDDDLVDAAAEVEVPVAVVTDDTATAIEEEDEEEGAVDLDEELHPDDVEAPLDALLKERTAAQT